MTLLYFAQRGRWAGYWRRVPLQRGNLDILQGQLRDRGHFLTQVH